MTSSFALGFERVAPDRNGHATAFIRIGLFLESFPVPVRRWPASAYLRQWHRALRRLVAARSSETTAAEALLTRLVAPGRNARGWTWILYLHRETVFVQNWLLAPPWNRPLPLAPDGHVLGIPPRRNAKGDTPPPSEWKTSVDALREFLHSVQAPSGRAKRPNQAMQPTAGRSAF
jgi:hypothetical protein